MGAAKGLITGLASLSLGIFPDYSTAIGLKWLHTGILGLLLLPLLALVGHSLEQIETKNQLLISEKVRGLLSNKGNFAEQSKLISDFKELAANRLDRLEERVADRPLDSQELVREAILDLIDNYVKPLSRKIYREDSRSRKPLNLPWTIETVYRNGFTGHSVAFAFIFVTLFLGYLQVSPLNQALAESGSVVLLIFVTTIPLLLTRPKGLSSCSGQAYQ
jgi:hypothetical protein